MICRVGLTVFAVSELSCQNGKIFYPSRRYMRNMFADALAGVQSIGGLVSEQKTECVKMPSFGNDSRFHL